MTGAEIVWLRLRAFVEVGMPAFYAGLRERDQRMVERENIIDALRKEAEALRGPTPDRPSR